MTPAIPRTPTDDVNFVSTICLQLTKYLQTLPPRQGDGLSDAVFVSAVCTQTSSQYQGLVEIFRRHETGRVLQSHVTRIDKATILKYGYQLGRLCCGHKSKKGVARAEFREFAKLMDNRKLRDLFNATAPLEQWLELGTGLLRTLESVKFEESILTTHFGFPPMTFDSCVPVGSWISSQVQADPVFHYGRLCEQLVFASLPDFHYCYLPGFPKNMTAERRWALCLWTGGDGSTAFETLKKDIELKVKELCSGRDPHEIENEDVRRKEMDGEWERIKEWAMAKLDESSAPEAHQVRSEIAEASRAYEQCSEYERRSRFLDVVRELKRTTIVPTWHLKPAIDLLGEK